ncbi:MAG: PEP-CTERM sorting domain-containing protein [Sedimentisphaerales bacterium]
MKKLLVLLMVLGLVSSAQASLSLSLSATTVAVGSNVTCSVIDSVGEGWTWQFVLSEDTYNWTDPVAASYNGGRAAAVSILAAAGNMAAATPDGGYAALVQLSAGGTTPAPSTGTQFNVTLHGEQAGTIYMDLEDFSANSQSSTGFLTLVVTPEPMTMALLGLGGLFLRRRK